MRWLAIPLVVCVASATAFACPIPDSPKIVIGGEVIERRADVVDGRVDYKTVKRLPSRPQFYLHLPYQTYDDGPIYEAPPLPVFRRDDGALIPFAVEPTGLPDFPFTLTLAIERGTVVVDWPHGFGGGPFVVEDIIPATRHVSVPEEMFDGVDLWKVDSDATLFRIDGSPHVNQSDLFVGQHDTLVAVYPDGREEILQPGAPRSTKPWWLLGLGIALVSWLLGRRVCSVVHQV